MLEHNTTKVWIDNDFYNSQLLLEWEEYQDFQDIDQLFYNRQRAEVEARYPALVGLHEIDENYQCSWKLPKNLKDRRRIVKQLLNR